ncbi:hypothetical protein BU16DRAFT_539299 [Lophium mytilinum]|uniref:Uncharacterized protein n=1 Tax=Lophium mytilinum TaxID=390894 RepID=A0A6A6QSG1_9PEZI|nr:hypothetical protein BU16DRAFT_539299 [Lophium mytilinum]
MRTNWPMNRSRPEFLSGFSARFAAVLGEAAVFAQSIPQLIDDRCIDREGYRDLRHVVGGRGGQAANWVPSGPHPGISVPLTPFQHEAREIGLAGSGRSARASWDHAR